jgi:hypothetical protein
MSIEVAACAAACRDLGYSGFAEVIIERQLSPDRRRCHALSIGRIQSSSSEGYERSTHCETQEVAKRHSRHSST